MARKIFIGDVHGCRDELVELLDRLSPTSDDGVILLGDLIDRGPDPKGVVRLVRDLGYWCILGNHEEKALRFLRHEARREREPGYKNPMKAVPEPRRSEWLSLDGEERAYLAHCPPFLDVLTDWYAVHGGFVPGLHPYDQRVPEMIRCRWVDDAGKHVGMVGMDPSMPAGARPWMEAFDGPFNVVCGHAVHSLTDPRVDRTASGFEAWSIDTGCCFGGRLTALVLDEANPEYRGIVQVQARRQYSPRLDVE